MYININGHNPSVTHERVITRGRGLSQFDTTAHTTVPRTLLTLSVDRIKLMALVHDRSTHNGTGPTKGERRAEENHDETRLNPNCRSVSRGTMITTDYLCSRRRLAYSLSFPYFLVQSFGIGFPINDLITIHSIISFLRFLLPVGLNRGHHYPRYTLYFVHSNTLSFATLFSEHKIKMGFRHQKFEAPHVWFGHVGLCRLKQFPRSLGDSYLCRVRSTTYSTNRGCAESCSTTMMRMNSIGGIPLHKWRKKESR